MNIHPTAVVGSKVILGKNIEIGPYAIVEDGVTIGDDCRIQAHAVLTNRVTLGARNFVGYGAVLGAAPQDFAHDDSIQSEVIIGDGNTIREYVTIHRGTKEGTATRIGDGNYLMVGVHLGHNVSIGNRNVIANNCLIAGYVEFGDGVVAGGGAVFHQFIRIGSLCMIRGGTAWGKDLPPYTVGGLVNTVCGLNTVGLRRNGVGAEGRASVKRAYQLFFRSGLNVAQALEEAAKNEWLPEAEEFIAFIAKRSKRGLCRARQGVRDPASEGAAEV